MAFLYCDSDMYLNNILTVKTVIYGLSYKQVCYVTLAECTYS